MKVEVKLPDLGDEAVEDVSVSAWLSDIGAVLHEGDDLLEITTDKAAFCVPCPRDGVLSETRVKPGDEIKVGDTICVLDV